MSNKRYGLSYERKEKKFWESQGFKAFRNRGSFGLFDLIVATPEFWRLISVKSTKQDNYSYGKELRELIRFGLEVPKGTIKMLVLYHKGKRKVLYDEVI